MSLLDSLLEGIFGKKQPPKKKPATAKKTPANRSSAPSKAKTKPPVSASTKPERIIDADVSIRYTIPLPPTPAQLVAQSRATWCPPGRQIRIEGRFISDGMLYVGSKLTSLSGRKPVDPALIDPAQPVARKENDTTGRFLSYWPSYSELPPQSRAAYLDWLAAGRPAGAPIGYVFLFFYGIERRVLFDAQHDTHAQSEIPILIQEVERLKRLYPAERSFQGYTAEFLVAAQSIRGVIDPREIEPPLPARGWELPLSARVVLGSLVANGQPIPPVWALSWLYCDPNTFLRTPATRCQQEFMTLFRLAYQQQFGAGMVVEPPRKTVQLTYRPASATFSGVIEIGKQRLPDIAQLQKPQFQLRQIADVVTEKLDAYSRAIGSGLPGTAPTALAYLPSELGEISRFPAVAPLAHFLKQSLEARNDIGRIAVAELLSYFPELVSRPSQKQCNSITRLIERLGYGLEPDPTTNRKAFLDSRNIGLYWLADQNELPVRDLGGAIAILSLGTLMAGVDGTMTTETSRLILDQVMRASSLSAIETRRMRAHLVWLSFHPPTLSSVRKRLAGLSPAQAAQTGSFLITLAGIDGTISPAEIKMLSRLYEAMGSSERQLHSDLHTTGMAPGPARQNDLVRNRPRSKTESGAPSESFTLDPAFLELVRQQTNEIAHLLDQVFAGDDSHAKSESDADTESPETKPITEQSDPYEQFINLLAERSNWDVNAVSSMATSLGLMTAGAIETINDRAIARGLDPLLDCDDVICDVYAPTLNGLLDRG